MKNLYVLVLWTKVVLGLDGLIEHVLWLFWQFSRYILLYRKLEFLMLFVVLMKFL